jgi:ElaB/YqjD/DUF883 family membrane-anchored ribosome-binding protein
MAAGFMAGFGSTMSKLIEDDREYYRELATKKRDYLQTYGTKAVLDRDEKANGAVSLFNTLVTAGIPEDSLRYVLDTTGVAGLTELRSTLNSRDDLTPSQIKGLVKKSKDYVAENPNEDITEVMRRAYGLYKSTDNPVEQETNMFAAVLGLDSRMMEQAALNDVYVDGFKGTDLYAIMARGGPKAGEALSLNLPNKPPSTSEVKMVNEALQNKFEQSIDAKIANLKTQQSDENTTEKAKDIIEQIKALETLKGRGVLGYADWGNIDKTFWDYAKSLEDIKPGYVTLNPTLIEFSSKYNTYWGDKEDDAKLEGNGQQPPAGNGDTPVGTSTTAPVAFETADAFDAAVESGTIEPGAKVKIGNNTPQTFSPPPDYNYKNADALPLEEDNRSRLLSEAITPTPSLTDDDMGLPDGPLLPPNVTDAIISGQAFGEDVSEVTSTIAEAATAAPFKAVAAISDAVAYAADFIGGAFGAQEETSMAKRLRESAKQRRQTASEIAAEGVIVAFGLNSTPEAVEQVAQGFRNTVFTEDGVRTADGLISYADFAALKGKPQENVEPRFIRKGMQITLNPDFVEPEPEQPSVESTLAPLDITDEEGMLRRVQDQDRQFLADEKNYPQPITGFVTPAKTEEEKRLEAEMVKVDESLRRVQDLDRQFLADEKNYPQPISAMTSVDPLSINTRSDLMSAIADRTGTMPPDYKEQMVSAVATINEALKTFEDSVNVKAQSAIDAVSISNINESITNIVDRMFDTVVGNETLEDRIMKTEAGQNRAYAFTKLQDQFGALTLFPERIPGDIDLGPTMGEVASEYLHSTQDKINESIASAFKSLLSKIGIGKPEPLVTRPR